MSPAALPFGLQEESAQGDVKRVNGRLVQIGVPAYNNAATLARCLDSLLGQTYGNIQITISDDQSSDETGSVGLRYAQLHARVLYVRQPFNLKYQNFGELLRTATADYFMWAAGDDVWEPDFVARCVAALEAAPDAVIAVTDVEFVNAQTGERRLARGVQPLDGDWKHRFCAYLAEPADNSRMYGVMRTVWAQQCFPAASFHAFDWAFSAATTKFGRHIHLPGVGLVRDKTPTQRYVKLARADSVTTFHYLLPVWRMSAWLVANDFVPWSVRAWCRLAQINLFKHREVVDEFHPYIYHPSKLVDAFRRRL